ncbi:MAG: hypothetical protein WC717_05140 [Candidatus Micrarchaeia archaeon]|jgi:hypothetical protein
MPINAFNRLRAFRFAPEWKKKTGELNSKLEEFSRLFSSKNYPTPDELFFEIEDLPSFGKEYWFLHFCAPPRKEQVILTVGRSVDPVRVNDKAVPEDDTLEGVVCAAVCWLYSQKGKQVVFDSTARVRLEKGEKSNLLEARQGKSKITITGKYPSFGVELVKGGRKIFTARAFPPREGLPYELVHLMKTPLAPRFGAAMINYYFDFEGVLEGKKLSGKAYLQKVVAVLPLAPWNWVRLHFAKGVALDFFAGKPLGEKSKLHFACNDYVEIKGRRVKLRDLKLFYHLSGDRRIWILSGKNLFAVMESYALQPFIMKQKTTFRYDEYIVKVTSFAMREGGREYTLSDLGEGVGLVEDASGYLF